MFRCSPQFVPFGVDISLYFGFVGGWAFGLCPCWFPEGAGPAVFLCESVGERLFVVWLLAVPGEPASPCVSPRATCVCVCLVGAIIGALRIFAVVNFPVVYLVE